MNVLSILYKNIYVFSCKESKIKSNLQNTRCITPKRVTNGGAHICGLASWLHRSEETSQRWRAAACHIGTNHTIPVLIIYDLFYNLAEGVAVNGNLIVTQGDHIVLTCDYEEVWPIGNQSSFSFGEVSVILEKVSSLSVGSADYLKSLKAKCH